MRLELLVLDIYFLNLLSEVLLSYLLCYLLLVCYLLNEGNYILTELPHLDHIDQLTLFPQDSML